VILYIRKEQGKSYLNSSIPTHTSLVVYKIFPFFLKKFENKFKNILAPKIFKNLDWGL